MIPKPSFQQRRIMQKMSAWPPASPSPSIDSCLKDSKTKYIQS